MECRWILVENNGNNENNLYRCSNCGRTVRGLKDVCPNCMENIRTDHGFRVEVDEELKLIY